MRRPLNEIVIAFVVWQGEIVKVGLGVGCIPIMVAENGKKTVLGCACSISAAVWINKIVIVLPDVGIHRTG